MLNFLKKWFIPSQENKYKAGLISNKGLVAVCMLIISAHLTIYGNRSANVLGVSTDLTSEKIVEMTNQARKAQNQAPLSTHPLLEKAAYAKIHDMFEFGYWDHYSPSKRPPWTFIIDAGYSYQYAGENLGKDFTSAQNLVDAWLKSPEHRENLLNPEYEDIGIAVGTGDLNGQPAVLIVQFFGKRFPTNAPITVESNQGEVFKVTSTVVARNQQTASPMISTKIIALMTVVILSLVIAIDAWILHRVKKLPRISAKYWSHLLLLYTVGVVTVLIQ